MKKTILISLLATLLCSATYGATMQRTILSHNGQLTTYDANHWTEAINDAVAGDTVYFTPGLFYYNYITFDKPISLIGAGTSEVDAFYEQNGWTSVYSGCGTTEGSTVLIGENGLHIAAPVSMESLFLRAENNDGNQIRITITENVSNLRIKRCQLYTRFSVAEGKTLNNFLLESCMVTNLNCARMVSPTIQNCFISEINANSNEGITITNCMFGGLNNANGWHIINSAFWQYADGSNTFVNCLFINGRERATSTYTDCYMIEGAPQVLTKAELLSNSYLGNDGTVVGPLGGPAPFTLIPSQPYVSSSSVTYNKTTKKLNVNVTVKKGQ